LREITQSFAETARTKSPRRITHTPVAFIWRAPKKREPLLEIFWERGAAARKAKLLPRFLWQNEQRVRVGTMFRRNLT